MKIISAALNPFSDELVQRERGHVLGNNAVILWPGSEKKCNAPFSYGRFKAAYLCANETYTNYS